MKLKINENIFNYFFVKVIHLSSFILSLICFKVISLKISSVKNHSSPWKCSVSVVVCCASSAVKKNNRCVKVRSETHCICTLAAALGPNECEKFIHCNVYYKKSYSLVIVYYRKFHTYQALLSV